MHRLLCTLFMLLLPVLACAQSGYVGGNRTQQGWTNYCEPAGGTDTYACALNSDMTVYVKGTHYYFLADVANTGAATLNLNSIGAKTIKRLGGDDLLTGDICAGKMVEVAYDGANMELVSPSCKQVRSCVVAIGDPGAASSALADDNDSPVACTNDYGVDWTITTVACWANAGSPTVTPILTGGSSTSILTGALTCGTASWAAGTVQGTAPVVHSFSGTGATCSSTPCSIDVNLTSAGGAAKYVVIKITGVIP